MTRHKVKKQTPSNDDRKATRRAARRAARKAASKAASNASSEASREAASKSSSNAASKSSGKPPPLKLLAIFFGSLQIRREIYGYLLLDPQLASLAPSVFTIPAHHHRDDNEYWFGIPGNKIKPLEKEPMMKRQLAILRTNRQIYNEASALLHSEITVDIHPGDTITEIPGNAVVIPSTMVWRHAPSKGLGFTNPNGQTEYESAVLDGTVEPHVFARYEKLFYYAGFNFQSDEAAPILVINSDLRVRADEAAKFASYLTTTKSTTRWVEDPIPGRAFDTGRRETLDDVANVTISSITTLEPSTADILQIFVDLVSRSPLIRHLEFVLELIVSCEYSIEDVDSDGDSETAFAQKTKEEVFYERATEVFLESGVLDPLRQLSNVKCFSLSIAPHWRRAKVVKPEQKHLNIIRDLKMAIENNWVCEHGPH